MIVLTAGGSFAQEYTAKFKAEIASVRELGEAGFAKKIKQADVIIHNAASIQADDIEAFLERNFEFTRKLVRQLESVNPEVHLIFLSSMSMLDPSDDSSYGDVLSMSPYAYSKYLAETYCLKSTLKHVSSVRFSTLFYEDPVKDGLSKLINDAVIQKKITVFNGGEAKRNFLPLHIAAQYVEKITRLSKPGKEVYNLAAPTATAFKDAVSILKDHIPELVVDDKKVPATGQVLAEFKTTSIDKLGRIDFSLEDEINSYIRKLDA